MLMDGSEDALIDAVAELKLEHPAATAKEIHGLLIKQEEWTNESLSRVKKACSKAGKRGLTENASFHHMTQSSGQVGTSFTIQSGPDGIHLVGDGASDSTWARSIRSVRLSDSEIDGECLPFVSAIKASIEIGPTLSENSWAGGFKGVAELKGRPVYEGILVLDNQLAIITVPSVKQKPVNKVASEIAGCTLFGDCYFLLVGRKPIQAGMHELYYFTEELFKQFVQSQDDIVRMKAIDPKMIMCSRYHWNILPLDQREPFVLGSPVTVVARPTFSGKYTRPCEIFARG